MDGLSPTPWFKSQCKENVEEEKGTTDLNSEVPSENAASPIKNVDTLNLLGEAINTKMRYEQIIEQLMTLCVSLEAPPSFAQAAKEIVEQTKLPVEYVVT